MARPKAPRRIKKTETTLSGEAAQREQDVRARLSAHRDSLSAILDQSADTPQFAACFDQITRDVAAYEVTVTISSTPRENLQVVNALLKALQHPHQSTRLDNAKEPFRNAKGGLNYDVSDAINPLLDGDAQKLKSALEHERAELAKILADGHKLRGKTQAVKYLCGRLRLVWQICASTETLHDGSRRCEFANKVLAAVGVGRVDDPILLDRWIETEVKPLIATV